MDEDLPARAETVIVGGGIAGASLAYHLTKLGCTDVVLLERGRLTCGTTWHAAGLIMQLRGSHAMTELARCNVELYANLERETGVATGFKQNGTLGVCRTKDRLHETRRTASIAASFGIEAQLIGPVEAKALYPALDHRLIEGAIYIPRDGQTNPVDTAMSLIAGARQRGARVLEQTPVLRLEQRAADAYRLTTDRGAIECETLVLACGLWTRDLAAQLGIRVPLYACEHMYVVTEPLDFVAPTLPVLRDPDGYVYVKEDAGRLLVGAFEPQGKPLAMDELPPDPQFVELPEDWEHYALPMRKAIEILPPLQRAGIVKFMNGPESFTPDLQFAIGEVPGRRNCFVSAGYNSEGIEFAPGAGRALAEWIVEGAPTMDLAHVDIARFHPFQVSKAYLHARAGESLGLHYKMHWPHRQREAARPVRVSPLHERWVARRACFGEALGWERPLWFAPPGTEPLCEYSYRWPGWFDHTAAECRAAREGVVVIDQTSFGKHLIQGADACRELQRLCAGDVDVPPGKVIYTHMLNRRGGIECDLTVNRLRDDRYLLVSSATTQPRDHAWIESQLDSGARASLTDVTSAYAVLSVQGPRSRALLARLTDTDLSNEAFPFATSREVEIGYARVIANRLGYVGELGWELFVPTEFAPALCDLLLAVGEEADLVPAGYHALEHLRSERAYREYELDLTPVDTPFEAGLGFTASLHKPGGFIGRDALLRQADAGALVKRLVMFRLHDPQPVLFGEEVIRRDGQIVGYLSSGTYGFTLGASVGMGYVRHPDGVSRDMIEAGSWELEIAGERFAAEASLRAFYDPAGERVRA